MAYTTKEKVLARIPAFDIDGVDFDDAFSEGMSDAQEYIDARLRPRYGSTVPFQDPVPGLIGHIAADLAAAHVVEDSYSANGRDEVPKYASELRKRAEKRLDDLLDGTLLLTDDIVDQLPGAYSSDIDKPTIFESFDMFCEPPISLERYLRGERPDTECWP